MIMGGLLILIYICFQLYRRLYCPLRAKWEISQLGKNLTNEGAEEFACFVEDLLMIPNYPIMYNRLKAGWGLIRDSRNISPRMKERVKVVLQSRGVVLHGGIGYIQRQDFTSNNQGNTESEIFLAKGRGKRWEMGTVIKYLVLGIVIVFSCRLVLATIIDHYTEAGIESRNQGAYDNAISEYNKAIFLQKFSSAKLPDTYCLRGWAYVAKGDYANAVADFNEAVKIAPQKANIYIERGKMFRIKNDYDKALADFTKAIGLAPKNSGYYEIRGETYRELGNGEQAETDFAKAQELKKKR